MMHPIREFRKKNKITLHSFAANFGVNQSTVMRWEKDQVPAERVKEIANLTGISKAKLRPDLFGREA